MNTTNKTAGATGTTTCQQRFTSTPCSVYQQTKVGFVTEVTPNETRVAVTPCSVREFVLNGHTVYFQSGAGVKAGYTDSMYTQAGATMVKSASDVWSKAQMMLKVCPPQPQEYSMVQKQQVIFCFTDPSSDDQQSFFQAMMQRQPIIMVYQNMKTDTNTYPVMNTVSEMSGFLAVQQAMKCCEAQMGGPGMIVGGIAGVRPTNVLVLGGGVAANKCAMVASALGANVTMMDVSMDNLRTMSQQMPSSVCTMHYSSEALESVLPNTDIVVGAVFCNTWEAPMLISERQMSLLKPGSCVVDLAIGQGGNFQTSRPTTFEQPTFTWKGITHFCMPNITCLTPYTASSAICSSAMPYWLQMANKGFSRAAVECYELLQAATCVGNYMTNKNFASITNMTYTPIEHVLSNEIKEATTTASTTDSTLMSLKQQLTTFYSERNETSSVFTIEA